MNVGSLHTHRASHGRHLMKVNEQIYKKKVRHGVSYKPFATRGRAGITHGNSQALVPFTYMKAANAKRLLRDS
jgi:hypothetical protein